MKKLGNILSGSLVEALVMRLDANCALEDVKTGKFVSIVGKRHTFFSLIIDLELEVTNPDILLFPPDQEEVLLQDILRKRDIYAKIKLRPMLMLDKDGNCMPVKTIPEHFATVYQASSKDVAQIFGDAQKDQNYFNIGVPLDMDTPVCINLDAFIERSNGIFGKSGTGKTFITRLILAGLIKSQRAVNLIFDMHSEYGFQARKEGGGFSFVKGLKTLFTNNVAIFSLDPESTLRRGCSPDVEVVLNYQDIHIEDIICLQNELNLHPTALEAAYLIVNKFKQNWLKVLLDQGENIKEFAQEIGAHPESIGALYRKLKRLENFSFLQKNFSGESFIKTLLSYLDKNINVVLEFGNNTSVLCYLLVANIITRRIHDVYIAKTEKFLASQNKSDEPKKLMITIEEAHKFLNTQTARQTIFGVIAREMRKYYVSLLIVDQRPSSIDAEILSQIGTKIVALLNDEKDIQAVLTGVNNSSGLRSILSTLDTKKQALVMGHAVRMPVVIKTRDYDEKFYKDMGAFIKIQDINKVIEQIF
ncbi:ATP-binding protein [Candidatus Babeliales bacterium]|nr:ATP-binding protein [Candidatus Babeliales bacterium]